MNLSVILKLLRVINLILDFVKQDHTPQEKKYIVDRICELLELVLQHFEEQSKSIQNK